MENKQMTTANAAIAVQIARVILTQHAAGRAWTDLMNSTTSNRAEMQANYDAAKAMHDAAYDAWKALQ